ncbi:MAG: bifunctional DNA primase/polymerase, partial [Hyphomicrobiales bacterium]
MSNLRVITKLRRQLLNNGYSCIPSYDKRCFLKGWPTAPIDEHQIEKVWARQSKNDATAIRVENGLCVIDIDIDHRIIDDVCEAMIAVLPEAIEPYRLERRGKGHKLAWYVRTDDLFSRLHSRKWVGPQDTKDDATHCVEIFGGGSPRYFGSYGPHTKDDDGDTKISYQWNDESPEDVPLNALPVVSKTQLFEMIDAAEGELKLQGFTVVARTTAGEGQPGKVYDLTEDMTFDLHDGSNVGMVELQEMVRDGYNGRCSADWLEGENSGNTSRCIVGVNGSNHLTIWESAEGMTHMPAAIAPVDNRELVDRIAERLREKLDKRQSKMNSNDDHVSGAAKLMNSYAFMPSSKSTPIIPLWSVSDDEKFTLANFRTSMMPYCGVEVGPKGGEKKINPVDVWLSNPNRIEVSGTRMRPDMERPTFDEHERLWINTYRPPNLGSMHGGTADGGVALMEQLVPDERERKWFMQWLAYKWKNPHVPGPAIIMVARDFGTGRGTFGVLLKLLFGNRYVKNVSFDIFSGQNYQSQYTEWALNALFAIVNESSATGDVSSYKAKHNVYEHLKETVEPRPTEKQYVLKGEGSIDAVSSLTSIIMTNNPDAIPLPEDDRRFAVLTNGQRRDPEFWQFIN